jgi:hypothetical protein
MYLTFLVGGTNMAPSADPAAHGATTPKALARRAAGARATAARHKRKKHAKRKHHKRKRHHRTPPSSGKQPPSQTGSPPQIKNPILTMWTDETHADTWMIQDYSGAYRGRAVGEGLFEVDNNTTQKCATEGLDGLWISHQMHTITELQG